jgi:sec-independent protein translocase protein TatC
VSGDEDELEASRAPLLDHLTELRTRLIWSVVAFAASFILCFAFANQILIFLLHPFEIAGALMAAQKAGGGHAGPFDLLLALTGFKEVVAVGPPLSMVSTGPLETFFTKMKIAGFGAIVVSFPVVAFQLYRFVAPGLYRREKSAFLPFLLAAPVLFVLGGALVYYLMLPFVLWFSLSQQILGGNVEVTLLPKVSEYMTLVTQLLLAFGLCFQLPVVLSLLGLAGLISSETLVKGRRYAIVAIVFVAAIVTPPDPISQIMLSVPIYLLYEVSIWCVRLMELRRKRADATELATTG